MDDYSNHLLSCTYKKNKENMKFPKIRVGLVLTVIGLILTYILFPSTDLVDTLCGLLLGTGVGLLIWGWLEKRNILPRKEN
jgi:hypothetical protein